MRAAVAAAGVLAGAVAVGAALPVLPAAAGAVDAGAAVEAAGALAAEELDAVVVSFLPHPAASSAAQRARGRDRIFMARTTLEAPLRHANSKSARAALGFPEAVDHSVGAALPAPLKRVHLMRSAAELIKFPIGAIGAATRAKTPDYGLK